MKLHTFRQDLHDYQDFLGLLQLYPVRPVDPVRKWKIYAVKFFFEQTNRTGRTISNPERLNAELLNPEPLNSEPLNP